ncbi:hypothetical protein A9986_07775 [Solibacillus silvestris]|nr:hypothetical protein [Solibacillus silvestris]OBW58835.1 hypothetical protein A9986_07775 [Solibacillus silvestris]
MLESGNKQGDVESFRKKVEQIMREVEFQKGKVESSGMKVELLCQKVEPRRRILESPPNKEIPTKGSENYHRFTTSSVLHLI